MSDAIEKLIEILFLTPTEDGWGAPSMFWGAPGIGKCLGKGTPVLMHGGVIKPVEEVRDGDVLMGPDSQPRTVVGTTRGRGPLFRVVPRKGAPWVCNDVHVLTLRNTDTKQVVDVPLNEYLTWTANRKMRFKLFQPDAVRFPNEGAHLDWGLPVDPYFLGLWLGDGTKDLDQGTQVTTADAEVYAACVEQAKRYGLDVRTTVTEGCPTYRLVGERGKPNALTNDLRVLMEDGVRVPVAYRTGTVGVRAAVLAGLLDSDGHHWKGGFEFVNKNVRLADDVAFVARSLGLRVTERAKVVNGESYKRLFIFGDTDGLPLRIARKIPAARRQRKDALNVGFDVQAIGEGDYYGFELDGDGRFLLGDFTVTHNTKMLRAFAAKYGVPVQVLSPGLMGDGAFGVTPVPQGEGANMRIHYPVPAWTDVFEDAGDVGLVFVDEITTAAPALQPPLLGLVQERRVGDHYLGERVRVIGAGNPPAQAAAGYDLPLPLANRMLHFEWPAPTAAAWSDHMTTRGAPQVLGKAADRRAGHPAASLEAQEKAVAAGWPSAYARAAGLVTAFASRRAELLHKLPADGDPSGSRAWPSHRSWDLATLVMATADILGADEATVDALVSAAVGTAAATEFVAFRVATDLPDPKDVLDGRVPWGHDPTRLDRSMAVLSSCAAFTVGTKDQALRETYASTLWTLVAGTLATAMDVAVPACRVLAKAHLGHVKTAVPVLVKMRPVLSAAGIEAT